MKKTYNVPKSVLNTMFSATNYRNGKNVSWFEVDLDVLLRFASDHFDVLKSDKSSRVLFLDEQGFIFGLTQETYGKTRAFLNVFTAFNNGLNLPEKEIRFHE